MVSSIFKWKIERKRERIERKEEGREESQLGLVVKSRSCLWLESLLS